VPKVSCAQPWQNQRARKIIDFTAFFAVRAVGIAKAKKKELEQTNI